jgi:heat shock protein HslJ
MKKLAVCLAVVVLLGACADSGNEAEPSASAPPGPGVADVEPQGLWVLREGHGPSGEIEPVEGSDITLQIADDGVRGSGGCNTYGGGLAIEGDAFTTGGLAVTEIGCPEPVAEPETRYVEALEAVDTAALDGKTLTLTGPDTELVFRRVPAIDPAPLTGTGWVLESLVSGDTASSTASSAAPAYLLLKDDKTFKGTTGCRSFTGTWTISGDVVDVTQLVFEGSCDRARDQDSHVAGILGTGFRAEVEGDQLILTAERGGSAIVYRAR